jgi:hypothetical protein
MPHQRFSVCVCARACLTSPGFSLLCVFKTLNLLNSGGKRRVQASTGTNYTAAVNVSSMILCVHAHVRPTSGFSVRGQGRVFRTFNLLIGRRLRVLVSSLTPLWYSIPHQICCERKRGSGKRRLSASVGTNPTVLVDASLEIWQA